MKLTKACTEILSQLSDMVTQIKQDDFIKPSESLGNSTIGQHLRHTIEFFVCLQSGFELGTINYDKRDHDKIIENDKYLALSALERIAGFVNKLSTNKPLKLEVGYDLSHEEYISLDT